MYKTSDFFKISETLNYDMPRILRLTYALEVMFFFYKNVLDKLCSNHFEYIEKKCMRNVMHLQKK